MIKFIVSLFATFGAFIGTSFIVSPMAGGIVAFLVFFMSLSVGK